MLREYFAQHRADVVVVWETPMNDVWHDVLPMYSLPNPVVSPADSHLDEAAIDQVMAEVARDVTRELAKH